MPAHRVWAGPHTAGTWLPSGPSAWTLARGYKPAPLWHRQSPAKGGPGLGPGLGSEGARGQLAGLLGVMAGRLPLHPSLPGASCGPSLYLRGLEGSETLSGCGSIISL